MSVFGNTKQTNFIDNLLRQIKVNMNHVFINENKIFLQKIIIFSEY